jgi:hypothetical protein
VILRTVITCGAVIAIIALSRFIWAMLGEAIKAYRNLHDDDL